MEEMDKSLAKLCKEFDALEEISDKHEVLDLMDRLADIRNKINREDRDLAKVMLDHEEADRKIDATFAIQESKEVREDRQFELEQQKVDIEKEKLTKEERAEIAKAAITGVMGLGGGIGAAYLGYKGVKAGLQNTANIFANLNEWDKNDVIPLSTGWDLFKKGFKG